MNASIWIGFDPRETDAYAVARHTARRASCIPFPVHGIILDDMRRLGVYTRETQIRDGVLFDVISQAPMSTEFAISRFLTPYLAKGLTTHISARQRGWALFVDADVMFVGDPWKLFEDARSHPEFAVMCVKHNFNPPAGTKMDGQVQTQYARKNWSSVMLFNLDHPANDALTPELVNTLPGRDLHRFCWLDDKEIGELDPSWNFLVGHHSVETVRPNIIHFTDGVPSMDGYEKSDFASAWREALNHWGR